MYFLLGVVSINEVRTTTITNYFSRRKICGADGSHWDMTPTNWSFFNVMRDGRETCVIKSVIRWRRIWTAPYKQKIGISIHRIIQCRVYDIAYLIDLRLTSCTIYFIIFIFSSIDGHVLSYNQIKSNSNFEMNFCTFQSQCVTAFLVFFFINFWISI